MLAKINYCWRLVATATAFTLFGIGGVLVPPIAVPVIKLISRDPAKRQENARKFISVSFVCFINIMRGLGILTWSAEGLEKLQRKRLLVLANHPTLLDVVFLVAFIPHADCVVKSKLLRNPSMRGYIGMTGYITNDAGAALIEGAKNSLDEGSALIIFPEGTRTREGEPLSFQRGSANIIIRAEVSPTPVLITCDPPTLSKELKWYEIPPRKFHMTFKVLDDWNVSEFQTDAPSKAARQLTRFLENRFTEELKSNES